MKNTKCELEGDQATCDIKAGVSKTALSCRRGEASINHHALVQGNSPVALPNFRASSPSASSSPQEKDIMPTKLKENWAHRASSWRAWKKYPSLESHSADQPDGDVQSVNQADMLGTMVAMPNRNIETAATRRD